MLAECVIAFHLFTGGHIWISASEIESIRLDPTGLNENSYVYTIDTRHRIREGEEALEKWMFCQERALDTEGEKTYND